MPTGYMDPALDWAAGTYGTSSGSTHYALVDDAVRQPSTPNTADYLRADGTIANPNVDEFLLSAPPGDVGAVSEIKVWVYGYVDVLYPLTVSIDTGAGYVAASPVSGFTDAWQSVSFTAGYTAGDVGSLKVRLSGNNGGSAGPVSHIIYAVYVEITYTAAVPDAGSKARMFLAFVS